MMNAALALAAGEEYAPLVTEPLTKRRVMYVDFESLRGEFRQDLCVMLQNIKDRDAARRNIIPFVDVALKRSELNFSIPEHLDFIADEAGRHKADLIIIDTVSAAFCLDDENSNAEVDRKIITPLTQLARRANAAVWFAHHAGKPQEGGFSEAAYLGRGASSFGTRSRTVFTLSRDRRKGEDYVVLGCGKSKGRRFSPTLLKLDPERRWFDVCAEAPASEEVFTAQEIAALVAGRHPAAVQSKEIYEAFEPRASRRTIDRRLKVAEKIGLIKRTGRGRYSIGDKASVGQ
jgi:hypothetical protein